MLRINSSPILKRFVYSYTFKKQPSKAKKPFEYESQTNILIFYANISEPFASISITMITKSRAKFILLLVIILQMFLSTSSNSNKFVNTGNYIIAIGWAFWLALCICS